MRLGPSLIGAVVGAAVGVAAHLGLESTMGAEVGWFALVIGVLTGFGARAMAGEAIRRTNFVRAGMSALIALGAIVGGSYAASEMTRKKNVEAYESAPAPPATVLDSEGDDEDEGDENDASSEEEQSASEEEDSAADEGDESEPTDEKEEEGDGEGEGEENATDTADEEADSEDSDTAQETVDTDNEEDTGEDKPAPMPLDLSSYENAEEPAELPMSPWQFAFIAIGTLLAYEIARGGGKENPPA